MEVGVILMREPMSSLPRQVAGQGVKRVALQSPPRTTSAATLGATSEAVASASGEHGGKRGQLNTQLKTLDATQEAESSA